MTAAPRIDPFDDVLDASPEDLSSAERVVRRMWGVKSVEQWFDSGRGYFLRVVLARDSAELREQVYDAVRAHAPGMAVFFTAA